MNAVVAQQDHIPPEPVATSLLQVIERAARDPNTDIDKMERLLALQERIVAKNAEAEFNQAMTAAQSEMGRISADATNPQTRSKYASYAKLDKVLRPIYTQHGFSLSFDEGESPKAEHVRVLCHVSHRAGHTRTYHKDMPADGKGAKGGDVMTKTHATGAAQTYGMRYLLKGIFNVAIGEEDRDGNEGKGGDQTLNQKQLADLEALITETRANRTRLLRFLKVERFEDILANNFDWVCQEIRRVAKNAENKHGT